MLNIPKSKGPPQWPIDWTKVFGISSNTPNSDTLSKKWYNEAIKEVIKIRYTITISFAHYKDMHTFQSSFHQNIKMLIPVGRNILKSHSWKLQIWHTFNGNNWLRRGQSCSSSYDQFLGLTWLSGIEISSAQTLISSTSSKVLRLTLGPTGILYVMSSAYLVI